MVRSAGFGDLVEFTLTAPHPRDLLAAIPDDLVSAIALVGDAGSARRRLAEYFDAGVDEVCIHPTTLGDPGGERTLAALRPA
jgi:alkanesulfonate monooxygenase SsuD/methylene tetrahydromethanopterin reductase-like flavin-dependent oxidoreductase (luciferase family)